MNERVTTDADHFLPIEMNFDEASIKSAVDQIIAKWGKLDVLVNNAGYAVLGAFEEFSIEEVKQNFDVNVFGLMEVTQAVLPYMRKQQSGHIINLASILGTVTGPSQAIYSATKAAVIMMGEALADEVADFGIKVTAIAPSGVRTDFLDQSSMRTPAKKIAEYDVVKQTMRGLANFNHNQLGDPDMVGKAILEVAKMAQPPRRLYLGKPALMALQSQIGRIVEETNQRLDLSNSIDTL